MNHLICHTHWDREWFAPSSVTNKWLRELFENLFKLIEQNRSYVHVLDGQTLILEDLLKESRDLEKEVRKFVERGNLLIGPFYAQIDFRLSSEAAILKNLEIGKKDMENFGVSNHVAWAVDNFGFVSQLPQILKIYGVEDIFLWRGVRMAEPSLEFLWHSVDGSQVRCIFLLGGYRNLYGLRLTKDLAEKRLHHEKEKLKPFSKSDQIPLLDGYDLETKPEDPSMVLRGISLSSPKMMIEKAFSKSLNFPNVTGELLSGKYACVFPGTLSTRSYLKRQSYAVEKLLRYTEFLGLLSSKQKGELYREYLKTLVHDNICGVGIDLVHESMSKTYRKLYVNLRKNLREQLEELLKRTDLRKGTYALSFSPYSYDLWYANDRACYRLKSSGVGLFKIKDFDKHSDDLSLSFKNDYYTAQFQEDGTLKVNGIVTGILMLQKELGDAYSTFTEDVDFSVYLENIQTERTGKNHKVVSLKRTLKAKGILIKTQERVIFDQSPLIKWQIKVDSRGKQYTLIFAVQTQDKDSKVFAKMSFEIVQRERKDKDLLTEKVDRQLERVLLAARETGFASKFPFQGFVALSNKEKTKAVMARGVHEYEVDEEGLIKITLIRSVEWIAKKEVKGRSGDAGPLMLVPGARCEGCMDFELAICELKEDARSSQFMKWYYLFDDSPIRLSLSSAMGDSDTMTLYSSQLPWVCEQNGRLAVYNPFPKTIDGLEAGKVSSVELKIFKARAKQVIKFKTFDFPSFPHFNAHSRKSDKDINTLNKMINEVEKEIEEFRDKLQKVDLENKTYHSLMHGFLTQSRTLLELKISRELIKGRMPRKLMRQLNEARSKKRIYDYIVELQKEE
ncbi:glycoside hydrolase family 38 C-terminal domain-containing protein [Pseudothermotoga sp. U03pept]|uniref:glycoside hydrolase family 38 N-terminal domain-containing protein n=1 Tax=Pseudothermotoga sp. U03pept TaxID=3447012 RepID=UPI003F00E720